MIIKNTIMKSIALPARSFIAFLIIMACFSCQKAEKNELPNIVVILADKMRANNIRIKEEEFFIFRVSGQLI